MRRPCLASSVKSVSLAAGDNSEVTYTKFYSDQTEHPGGVPWSYVKLVVSDDAILEAKLLEGGTLIITPKAVGSATITTERVVSEGVTFNPLPAFVPDSIAVTVTA